MRGIVVVVCYGGAESFGVVLDFVSPFIEFLFAEQVVDGFVVPFDVCLKSVSNAQGWGTEGSVLQFQGIDPSFCIPIHST